MAKIVFSGRKQPIAEFDADELTFAQQSEGLLLSAQGTMVFQETVMLAEMANTSAAFQVTITKEGATVIDQAFQITFFTLEADTLVALLQ